MGFLTPKMPAMPAAPAPLPEAPSFDDEERKRLAAEKEDDIRRARTGRKSTILTSYNGAENAATVKKKTLLGG